MTQLILEGGTDVAEMAVFCSDSTPDNEADYETIDKLEKNQSLIRLPTGGDGGYLIHMYINEPIDDKLLKYCINGDLIIGTLITKQGNISFGGVESASKDFKPNKAIRSDGEVPAGKYNATFYQTDFPESVFEDELKSEVNEKDLAYSKLPARIISYSILPAFFLLIWAMARNSYFFIPLLALVFGNYWAYKSITSTRKYKEIDNKIHEVNNQFPSIVAELKIIT